MKLPFAAKWTIREDELIALKDSANGRLLSTYVTTSAGIQYCLQICPNGNRKENHGKVFVFLVIKIGNLKEVEATCTVTVESANNYTKKIEHVYKESRGWGKCFCSTSELFDAQKRFIHDGKMELKVDGLLIFGEAEKIHFSNRGNLGDELWAYEETKDFKILVDGKVIKVHKLVLATMSPVFDDMFKSNSKEIRKNQLTISGFSFNIVEIALKEIYCCNFSFGNYRMHDDTLLLIEFGIKYNIPFIKINMLIFRINIQISFCDLMENMHQNLMKLVIISILDQVLILLLRVLVVLVKHYGKEMIADFLIIVDGKEIKVHKLVFASRSPTFAAMLSSKSAEAVKDQTVICDFSFDTVECAIKTIYDQLKDYSIDDTMLHLQFLYKYGFISVKDDLETVLLMCINALTVCRLTSCAIITNSTKLQVKCMEFITTAMATKTAIYDIGTLDKYVALKIVQNAGHRIMDKDAAMKMLQDSLYQVVYTRKGNIFSSIMSSILKK